MVLPDIGVTSDDPARVAEAGRLAAALGLPVTDREDEHLLLLRLTSQGLELVKQGDPNLSGSVRVDFTSPGSSYRRLQKGKELLVRAVGRKGGKGLAVIDATGGLGRDSFLLAAAGCRVRVFEQQPIVAALLEDGLQRALARPETALIADRIRLTIGDAIQGLRRAIRNKDLVDVVYLDPMFPARQKSALVKKELQFLQLLTEEQPPEPLLNAALAAAQRRVVVKRPRKAPWLTDSPPSHSLTGKTIRFDVYMIA